MTIGGIKMKFQVKYLFLILIIATIFPLSIKSQSTFMKFFGADGKYNEDSGYSVLLTNDGGYISCGLYDRNGMESFPYTSGDIFIVRTDANGDTLWTKTYGDPLVFELGSAIFNSDDGGYFVFYNSTYEYYVNLMKISSQGDSLWTKHYSEYRNHPWVKNIKQSRDKKSFLVAARSSADYLLKIDSLGNILWSKTYDSSQTSFRISSVAETNDGGYILSNRLYFSETNVDYIGLIKIDDSLNIQWQKIYPSPENFVSNAHLTDFNFEVLQTSDGGYFSIGGSNRRDSNPGEIYTRGWLLKTDEKGDTLWTRLTGPQNYISGTYLYAGLEDSDRNLVALGNKQGHFLYIIKLKPDGTIIWEREFGIYSELEFRGFDVKETIDGGYIVTGQKHTGYFDYSDLFLIKVNKDGILVSIKSEEETIPTNFELAQNYPNPFNPTTTIRYKIPTESFVKIKIYNALGEEVRTLVNEVQKYGIYEVQFIPGNIASGIYFYTLQAEQNVLSRKMIYVK
jgi:hypothetical protein